MTKTVIDTGNKLIVYLLTLLSLEQIKQVGSGWVDKLTETLCGPTSVALPCFYQSVIVDEFGSSYMCGKNVKDERSRC